jgi:hypothetical protein
MLYEQKLFFFLHKCFTSLTLWAIMINLGFKHPSSLPHSLALDKGKGKQLVTYRACQWEFIAWFCNLDRESFLELLLDDLQ